MYEGLEMNAEQELRASSTFHGGASPLMYPPGAPPVDEISLIDLWRILSSHWKLIAGLTCLSVLCAVVYLVMTPRVYEATAFLLPAAARDVEILNIPGINNTATQNMFVNKVKENLESKTLLKRFAIENQKLFPSGGNYNIDLPNIKNINGKEDIAKAFSVSLQSPDAKYLAEALNAFILFAEQNSIDDYFADIETNVANRKKAISTAIQISRDFAVQRRQDRIALLEEQIVIARAANIIQRKTLVSDPSDHLTEENQSVNVEFNTIREPFYRRGVKELTSEKEALEKRKDEDPYNPTLRQNQEELAKLEAGLQQFQAAKGIVQAVKIDQQAVLSDTPVKPKPRLVMALSLVLGMVIGVFAAFMISFVQHAKSLTTLSANDSPTATVNQ